MSVHFNDWFEEEHVDDKPTSVMPEYVEQLAAVEYSTSRAHDDMSVNNLLRDVAFNRHSMNDGEHVSPLDNSMIQIGDDAIEVRLVQPVDEEMFKRVMSMATRATIGLDLSGKTMDDILAQDNRDWEEMLGGGLQTALETAVIVFAVSGVSRTCTHQLVRSRRASFHQQSQRAGWYGAHPEVRMPESVWLNERARPAFLAAKAASDYAYNVACDEDISYQDARYALLEGTDNYILCEYSVREFMNVFAYRGCSMFSWEIVSVMRKMRALLVEAHPWLEPYVKISCEGPKKCTFQGWETVEGQCDFPWAQEENRTFKPQFHKIERRPGMLPQATRKRYTAMCESCRVPMEFDSLEDRDAWVSDHETAIARRESTEWNHGNHKHFTYGE